MTFTYRLIFFLLLLAAFAPESSVAADLDDQMNVSIQIGISWNKQFDRTLEYGKLKVRVNGMIKLAEKEDQLLRYTPEQLTAHYDFEFTREMTDPTDQCFGKTILEERGSGTATPQLEFQAMLGQLGQMHALQYVATSGGGFDMGKMIKAAGGQEGYDAYTFMLLLPGSIHTIENELCPHNNKRSMPRTLPLQVRCSKVTPKVLRGSYSWSSDVEWTAGFPPPLELAVGSCQETEFRGPSKGDGPVSYQVQWQFGDIQPVIEIRQEGQNITDETSDMLVGRKVKLEAKILPEGLVVQSGQWEVAGDVIADYITNASTGKVVPLDDKALKKQKIEYYYTAGDFAGRKFPVKWSGRVNNKDVKASATIKVFKPKVSFPIYNVNRNIDIGPFEGDCCLYLGTIINPGSSTTKAQGVPGMDVESQITMPPVDQTDNRLQYVQIIKEDFLHHLGSDYLHAQNTQWCLDTSYPANNRKPTPDKADFNDTPHMGIETYYTKQMHIEHQFELFLMFKPSSNKDDTDAIWVPAARIDWQWAAGIENVSPGQQCNRSTFSFLYSAPPQKKAPVYYPPLARWPQWNCNVTDKDKKSQLIGSDGNKDDTEDFENRANEKTNKYKNNK